MSTATPPLSLFLIVVTCMATASFTRLGGLAAPANIFNGVLVPSNQYTFTVSLVRVEAGEPEKHHCTGSLLNEKTVLTAAHCFYKNRDADTEQKIGVTAVIGTHDLRAANSGLRIPIVRQVFHANYTDYEEGNDIALLELKHPVNATKHDTQLDTASDATKTALKISYAELARKDSIVLTKAECVVLGWGAVKLVNKEWPMSGRLMQGKQYLIDMDECTDYFDNADVAGTNVCARAKSVETGASACLGDSGGPLMCFAFVNGGLDELIYGVTSYTGSDCTAKAPTVFGSVVKMQDWIEKNLFV